MRKRKDAPSRRELLAIIRRLEARNAGLEKRIGELEAELAKARKNSSTSSKPPSSDIVKPPKSAPTGSQSKRKIGGQPGHPKHERPPFPPEAVDASLTYTGCTCPACGRRGRRTQHAPRMIQQVEIVASQLCR